MLHTHNLNRDILFDLLKGKYKKDEEVHRRIHVAEKPVEYVVSRDLVEAKNFYVDLAQKIDLNFIEQVPTPINSSGSIIQTIPSSFLIEHYLFVYEENENIVVATVDPFLSKETFQTIEMYTGEKINKIVLAHPQEILQTLQDAYYYDLAITCEDRIHVLHPEKSTKTYSTKIVPRIFPISTLVMLAVLLVVFPLYTLAFIYITLSILYFLVNPFKFWVFYRAHQGAKSIKTVSHKDVEALNEETLPRYTILIPLKGEAVVVPKLVKNIFNIDYPKEKLDIKFITEVDDETTFSALKKEGVGKISVNANEYDFCSQLIRVPKSQISTKPRSCDYALSFARGQFTVIYDAEDKPDPDQLKKSVRLYEKVPLATTCIQARLNFYNTKQNIITRLFSLEYGFWFDYFLPGLEDIKSPIPLGGTSNHFVTRWLRKLGTWDPYNVTEDADLGLRIYRYGLQTATMDSYTFEEANSQVGNWIRQRTRWQKGFLLTFLVHTSRPRQLIKEVGIKSFILTSLVFGGNFFLPFFNPFLYLITILTLVFGSSLPFVDSQLLGFLFWFSLCNLIVGNGVYILIRVLWALKRKKYSMLPYTLLLPIYWIFLSYATWRAMVQFMKNPYYWEKTTHGLSSR